MYILASVLVSALGSGKVEHLSALKNQRSALHKKTQFHKCIPNIKTYIGEVEGVESIELPLELKKYTCRNNQLAWKALQVDGFLEKVEGLIEQFGAHRIGLVVGTSTSGIAETEAVFSGELKQQDFDYSATHQMDSLVMFCSQALHINGPNFVISTACSSSAKVFAVAQRWLDNDIVDALVVGGVDSLCLTTLHGFNSLGLVSETICKPLDAQRDGINVGEAASFMLLSNNIDTEAEGVKIVGVGESSDAFHISTPHPEGQGASIAMQAAIDQAGIQFNDIDYINLHGTATPSNDISEISALAQHLTEESDLWISSTKGFTGHTLGAAGITEIIFCQWALEAQRVPANLNLQTLDVEIENKLLGFDVKIAGENPEEENIQLRYVMSNSFGFGGNNASVILQGALR